MEKLEEWEDGVSAGCGGLVLQFSNILFFIYNISLQNYVTSG